MGMAAQVQTSPYVPTTVVKAYIKSFQGNMAAASEWGRIGYQSLDHAVKGEQRDAAFHGVLWGIIRKRLSRRTIDEAMTRHEQDQFAKMQEAQGEQMQKSEPLTIIALHEAMPDPVVAAQAASDAAMKECVTCKKEFAATLENFAVAGRYGRGLQPWCRVCHRKNVLASQAKAAEARRTSAAASRAAKAAATPAAEAIMPEEVTATYAVDALLSTRLLQLAVDADALEKQVAAAGGASAAKVEELEAEITSLRGLVKQLDGGNAALRERLTVASAYQNENAELLTRVANLTAQIASLTRENGKLWDRVDELAAACKQGKVA